MLPATEYNSPLHSHLSSNALLSDCIWPFEDVIVINSTFKSYWLYNISILLYSQHK